MSDGTGPPDGSQQAGGGGGNESIRQMRDAIERKDNRIAELQGERDTFRQAALSGVAHQAGYNPNDGPVKLVMEKFEADLTTDKLTPDAFTEYAKQWNVEPSAQQQQPAQGQEGQQGQQGQQQQQSDPNQPDPNQPDPAAQATQQQLNQLQSPGDQLQQAAAVGQGQTPDPSDTRAQVAKAEAEGRWDDAFALKVGGAPRPPEGFGAQEHTGTDSTTGLPTHTPSS